MANDLISLSSPQTHVRSLHSFHIRPVKLEKLKVRSAWEAATSVTLKDPYLVPTEAKSPDSHEELLKVLRMDRRSFYFHKQRHLFKRYERKEKTLAVLPPRTTHSLTPRYRITQETSQLHLPKTPTFSPRRRSIRTLVRMCGLEENRIKPDLKREKATLRQFSEEMQWTKHMLTQAIECGQNEIVPVLELEKEAEECFREDINRFIEDYHSVHRDPFQEAAKFAFMLRLHRNALI